MCVCELHTCPILRNIQQICYSAQTGQRSPLQGSCCPVCALNLQSHTYTYFVRALVLNVHAYTCTLKALRITHYIFGHWVHCSLVRMRHRNVIILEGSALGMQVLASDILRSAWKQLNGKFLASYGYLTLSWATGSRQSWHAMYVYTDLRQLCCTCVSIYHLSSLEKIVSVVLVRGFSLAEILCGNAWISVR